MHFTIPLYPYVRNPISRIRNIAHHQNDVYHSESVGCSCSKERRSQVSSFGNTSIIAHYTLSTSRAFHGISPGVDKMVGQASLDCPYRISDTPNRHTLNSQNSQTQHRLAQI